MEVFTDLGKLQETMTTLQNSVETLEEEEHEHESITALETENRNIKQRLNNLEERVIGKCNKSEILNVCKIGYMTKRAIIYNNRRTILRYSKSLFKTFITQR